MKFAVTVKDKQGAVVSHSDVDAANLHEAVKTLADDPTVTSWPTDGSVTVRDATTHT